MLKMSVVSSRRASWWSLSSTSLLKSASFYGVLLLILLLCVFFQGAHASPYSKGVKHERERDVMASSSEEEEINNRSLLIFAFILVVAGSVMVVYFVIVNKFKYLPESLAVVIYGIVLGSVLRFINVPVVKHLTSFDTEAFFLYILPCIIFESGFSLPKTPFFSNIGSILAFALVGTVVSFGVVGALLFAVGKAGLSVPLSFQESMIYSSFLSATDPVATLAIFQALNVDQTLYMIVLGESILNDAVALILYRASYAYQTGGGILGNISSFFVVFLGSSILGVFVAMLLSGIFRIVNVSRFPPLETILMVLFAYISYVFADALNLSGIMSVFWCGIAFNHYGAYSLSAYTTLTSRQLFRTAAFICETSVFIYIGMSLPTFQYSFDIRLVVWTVVFCFLARALHVFPLSFLLNLKKKKKLSWQIQIALWFAGLRGAIAFSLALATDTEHAAQIRTATLIFVHITLFVMGVGTLPLLNLLKIKTASSDQSLENITKQRQKSEHTPKKSSKISSIDKNYLKYWFRRPVQPLAREAVELFERLASNSMEEDVHSNRARALPDDNEDVKVGGYKTVSRMTDEERDNDASGSLYERESLDAINNAIAASTGSSSNVTVMMKEIHHHHNHSSPHTHSSPRGERAEGGGASLAHPHDLTHSISEDITDESTLLGDHK